MHTWSVAEELEFPKIVVEADWERFLWAVEASGDDTLVGIDFDVLEKDIPQDLMNRFARWQGIWDEAHQHVFTGHPDPEDFAEDQFHAEGRALAQELATVVGQPVEYRPWASQ